MSWDRRFEDPVELPDGRVLHTLRDAGEYITELPKTCQRAAEWLIATGALLLVVEHNGPTIALPGWASY